ncbi:hypothetical protein D3C76_903180 [compost metagenome]
MVLARPGAADPAMQHGADRALDPDTGVDVHDDAEDQHEACQCMGKRRYAYRANIEVMAEIRAPDHHTADQQHQHAHQQRPEQQLLPCVVLANRRHAVFPVDHHPVNAAQPQAVVGGDEIGAPEAHHQAKEEHEHRHAHERVQDACPGPAAEQVAEPEQRRVEQRQPGKPGQEEQDGDDPVVGPFVGVVAQDGFVVVHGRCSPCPPGCFGS